MLLAKAAALGQGLTGRRERVKIGKVKEILNVLYSRRHEEIAAA